MRAMRLARALHKTLGEIENMSATEFELWRVFDQHEPMPDPWYQTGMVCSTIVNMTPTRTKNARPDDFIPTVRNRSKPQSMAEGKARMNAYVALQQAKQQGR